MAREEWYQLKEAAEVWHAFVNNYFEYYAFEEVLSYVMELKPAQLNKLNVSIETLNDTEPDQLLAPFKAMDMTVIIEPSGHHEASIAKHQDFFKSFLLFIKRFMDIPMYRKQNKSETAQQHFRVYRTEYIQAYISETLAKKDYILKI